jgi:hypothetical protein
MNALIHAAMSREPRILQALIELNQEVDCQDDVALFLSETLQVFRQDIQL